VRLAVITDEIEPDLDAALRECQSLEIEAVELRTLEGRSVVEHDAAELGRAASALSAAGFSCPVIDTPFLKGPTGEVVWRELEGGIAAAHAVGAALVRVFSGLRSDTGTDSRPWIAETLLEAAERTRAAGLGLALEIEFVCNVATRTEAHETLAELDGSGIGLVWDPGNEARFLGRAPEPATTPSDAASVVHVHVKDVAADGAWTRPGDGLVDWDGELRALLAGGYDGFLSIETHYALDEGGAPAATRECVAAIRLLVTGAAANVWGFHGPAIEAVGAQVVAVHDPDELGVESRARELGCAVAPSFAELLEHEADALVVLAPHVDHPALALAGLDAGLHVLVEKPLAVSVEEADRIVEAADRAGRVVAVAFQQRSREEVIAARRIVPELGAMRRVDVLGSWPRRSSYFATAPWRGSWVGEGGGVLVNQGQHELDLLCHLAGTPARVFARTSTVFHPVETENTAAALLEWEDGALGSVHVTTAAADERQRVELTGSAGRLRLTPGLLERWRSRHDFREYAASPGSPYDEPEVDGPELTVGGGGGTHVELYVNFLEAVADRAEPFASGRDASQAVELANALILSAYLGREVDLPLDRAAYAAVLAELRRQDPAAPAAVPLKTEQEART
jgi:predicted dehydrogenase/sugar phosphate isomerase/epimerase